MISVDGLLRNRLETLAARATSEAGDGALAIAGLACLFLAAISMAEKRRADARNAHPDRPIPDSEQEFPSIT